MPIVSEFRRGNDAGLPLSFPRCAASAAARYASTTGRPLRAAGRDAVVYELRVPDGRILPCVAIYDRILTATLPWLSDTRRSGWRSTPREPFAGHPGPCCTASSLDFRGRRAPRRSTSPGIGAGDGDGARSRADPAAAPSTVSVTKLNPSRWRPGGCLAGPHDLTGRGRI